MASSNTPKTLAEIEEDLQRQTLAADLCAQTLHKSLQEVRQKRRLADEEERRASKKGAVAAARQQRLFREAAEQKARKVKAHAVFEAAAVQVIRAYPEKQRRRIFDAVIETVLKNVPLNEQQKTWDTEFTPQVFASLGFFYKFPVGASFVGASAMVKLWAKIDPLHVIQCVVYEFDSLVPPELTIDEVCAADNDGVWVRVTVEDESSSDSDSD